MWAERQMRAPAAAAVMPPPNPIAALCDIPVKKGAEAQLAKAAEAEARGKKRTAAQLPSNWSCPACATAAATPAT